METRANYVLIGAFALLGFLGILAFFLWFANLQLNRQFAYYDIDFTSVSGLSEASDVRFAGLPVGQVVNVRLSPNGDGTVRVRVEVDAETPVRTDSIATIEAQGVTGVSFVGISSGSPDAPLLTEASQAEIPTIEAGQSVLQALSQDAPQILEETLGVVRELRELIGGENQARVENILLNVERASESFAQALDDFSEVSGTVSGFAEQLDQFNATLEQITGDASGALSAAETTFEAVDLLIADARGVLAEGSGTLAQAETTIATADRYIVEQLGPATDQLRQSVSELEGRVALLSETGNEMLATFAETGRTATSRLTEAEETLTAANALMARLDETLQSVDGAAQSLDGLIAAEAQPLVAELRVATAEATSVIRAIGETAETDLPAIFGEIRSATENASSVIAAVGTDLSAASGRLDALSASGLATLESARTTFEGANETLSAINAALETGDRALLAAERAFDGADRVMNEDLAEISEGLSSTLDELERAIGAVAEDIPGVTEDLRAASRSAEAAFAGIETAVAGSAPAFSDFATGALPQYGRLAVETRNLIDNLDSLIEQIRRDPRRFFLDPRAPEFRR